MCVRLGEKAENMEDLPQPDTVERSHTQSSKNFRTAETVGLTSNWRVFLLTVLFAAAYMPATFAPRTVYPHVAFFVIVLCLALYCQNFVQMRLPLRFRMKPPVYAVDEVPVNPNERNPFYQLLGLQGSSVVALSSSSSLFFWCCVVCVCCCCCYVSHRICSFVVLQRDVDEGRLPSYLHNCFLFSLLAVCCCLFFLTSCCVL